MENKIAEKRKACHLTQSQVAKAVNIGERLYQSYEYGKVIPSVLVAIQIAKVLKTTVEELFPIEG